MGRHSGGSGRGTATVGCETTCIAWNGRARQGRAGTVPRETQGGERARGTNKHTNKLKGTSNRTKHPVYRGQGRAAAGLVALILMLHKRRDAHYERPCALCERLCALCERGTCWLHPSPCAHGDGFSQSFRKKSLAFFFFLRKRSFFFLFF